MMNVIHEKNFASIDQSATVLTKKTSVSASHLNIGAGRTHHGGRFPTASAIMD